ncbi:CaiB/BaiF CoA transferase family protein [Advenella mimigardefordensis]|uniref:Putative acyl-CoA transferase family 3 n=1 Tax=Advenella mimigardefordensis (strain DSM 17166 / LMG 22922 / DPN7) TaxID=1247726 RepID=W0P6R1_ADVMD|nr:CaiB/BaiF CoA-transferase family protein [Advenella mimigardefordensis]AHG62446.1 putative acyl-CoA transferase family 3 [Advenella mimigardefordensis DPN7]
MSQKSGPLSHVRVLDLSRIMAAPWASQLLADMGATVIKVERPGQGDDTRAWGPPFLQDSEGNNTAEAGYYLSVNRGKESITVALDTPEGQQIIRDLARDCDIVLENFKTGALAKYGLDYASLKQVNPRLIYCSVTGFGQDGPRKNEAAYDFLIQAMGGLMSVTGERDDKPGGGPQKVGIPIVDLMTGMYTAVAVLAALANREQTGQGDYIDLAMLDVQTAVLSNQAMNHLLSGKTPKRGGNAHPNIQPQDVYSCRDGDVILAVGNDRQFVKLCEALQRPELASDARFSVNAQRARHVGELTALLQDVFADWARADLVAVLSAAGVPCGPINSIPEVFQEPQVQHRRLLRTLPHPAGVDVPQVVCPINFTNQPLQFESPPPLLGQHTEKILTDLGYDAARVRQLRESGIV